MKTELLFSSFPFVSNDTVTLSQLQSTDSESLTGLFAAYGLNYNPLGYVQAAESAFAVRRYIELGIYRTDSPNTLLGTVRFGDFDHNVNSASLDFWIFEKQQETGQLAVSALLKFLFEYINFNRIYAVSTKPNTLWTGILERCGFVQEGCLRENVFVPEEGICSTTTYGLLKSEYPMVADSVLFGRDGALSIVRMTGRDYEQMAKWLSDEKVLKYYEGRDNPFTVEKVVEKFRPAVIGSDDMTPCIIREQGRDIGYIQFYPITEEIKELKADQAKKPYGVDLFIGESDCRNRGFGPRVLRLLCKYLFNEVGADLVIGDPQAWNLRSINAFAAAGFSQEVILPDHELHEGKMEANVIMHRRSE